MYYVSYDKKVIIFWQRHKKPIMCLFGVRMRGPDCIHAEENV